MSSASTIGGYLIKKFQEVNCNTIFGVPGDYILNFYKVLEQNKDKVKTVITCDEQGKI